jgi:hypothetical protein
MPVSKRPPIEVAAEILATKYPHALLGFVAGSFNRGEETAYSDIDLVVIFDRLEHGWRESFTFGGWPVEAFVHDPETISAFLEDDAIEGEPCLATMIVEGPIIPQDHPLVASLKTQARQFLDNGPPVWDSQKLDSKRYAITDVLDDLRDVRNKIEAAALIGALHEQLAEFYFRANGLWSASYKQIPRKLEKADPKLAQKWNEAFLGAWAGDTNHLIRFAEDLMAQNGGLLFDGYRSDAPKDKRIAVSSKSA